MAVLHFMRSVCTIEGFTGFVLNCALLHCLIRSRSNTNKIFQVPIYVSAIQGIYLGLAIGLMNFTHILHDGTLAVPLVGPAVQFIPKWARDLLFEIAFVFMAFMWTLTPATAILQITALSRMTLASWKRLLLAFTPTLLCLSMVMYTVHLIMPSPQLAEIASSSMKELYEMEPNELLETYAVSIKHADVNNGKSLLEFILLFAVIPYSTSYTIITVIMTLIRRRLSSHGVSLSKKTLRMQRQFFIMQVLQSFLPLAILSVPLAIAVYGVLNNAQLGFATLPLTVFCWTCPSVQAVVQLRYVKQTSATTPEPSRSGIVSTAVVTPMSRHL